jgi:diguanylate cyclase (GGDEF)-like protein
VGVCPRLRERQAGCAAICIPVSVLGRASGVLHLSAADGALPASAALQQVFHVAEQAGVRIGTLRALARIQQQADTDPLTGVLNRRAISDRVASLLTRGGAVCLGVADLDNFKRLNDVHGHATGDRALCAFTRMAVEELGEGNVGRWGGEEFLLVVPDADIDQARARLEQLRGRVFALRAPPIPVFSATIGVTSWAPGDHLEDLVRRADDALYEGKKLGRNQVRVWTHPEPEDVCLAAR